MKYYVTIWKSACSDPHEIDAWVNASDPVSAALDVMNRLGVRAAFHVIVWNGVHVEAEFVHLDLDAAASSSDVLVSYDYEM